MDFTGVGHLPPLPREYSDENTLFKVYDALREEGGLTEKQTRSCISAMQNRGILFRERYTPPADAVLCRAEENGGSRDVSSVARSTSE